MSNQGYQQAPLTPEIQKRIANSELLRKAELRRQAVAPSVNQQPLSSTPSTSEPAPSTTSVSLHDTPSSPHSEHGPAGAQEGSKGLFEGRPYGIGDLSGDQLAEITGDDRDKNPVGDYTRTLPDGTEVNVTRQGDGQYHIAPIASKEEGFESYGGDPEPPAADEDPLGRPGGGPHEPGREENARAAEAQRRDLGEDRRRGLAEGRVGSAD